MVSKLKDGTANLPRVSYQVGYGKPPAEHQFRKGSSGNPRGRPSGSRNKPKVSTEFGMMPAAEFLRQEAYRPVTLREGDRVIELPAIQAVFRAMGVSALKGNRFAQRTLAELVASMEEAEHKSRFELFGTALDYQASWEREIERCKAAGLPPPEPIPHPADIMLDPRTGKVRILGPQTREQKEQYDVAIARRDLAQQEVNEFARRHRQARDPAKKAMWLREWHFEQRLFDTINEALGKRYQRELENRSYAQGATRKGDFARKYGHR